ncbi:hypothetical protein EFR01_11370 [Sinorhizobium fredii]|nr:hypothetical protein EFR01_11370 [Sinorhizobium fredii]
MIWPVFMAPVTDLTSASLQEKPAMASVMKTMPRMLAEECIPDDLRLGRVLGGVGESMDCEPSDKALASNVRKLKRMFASEARRCTPKRQMATGLPQA